MRRIKLPVILLLVSLGGCAAQSPPNANLTRPGASAVTVDGWQVEARGQFIDPERIQIEIDLVVRRSGDPTRVIASPTMVVVVGEESVVEVQGNGNDVTCVVATRRTDSGAVVDVTTRITKGSTLESSPQLRFRVD